MKAWLLVLIVASVALAGCGGKSNPLDPYLVAPSETPDACYFLQPDEDMAAQMAALGFGSNPGSISNKFATIANITPIANRVEIFECKFGDETPWLISVAARFSDSRQATDWVLAAQDMAGDLLPLACDGHGHVFVDRDVVGGLGIIGAEEPAVEQAMHASFARILRDTGAKEYCPT